MPEAGEKPPKYQPFFFNRCTFAKMGKNYKKFIPIYDITGKHYIKIPINIVI
jgi:hypothetical protein